jgi:hypothetical protein
MGKFVLRTFVCDLVYLYSTLELSSWLRNHLDYGSRSLGLDVIMRLSDIMGGKALLVLAFGQSLGIMRLKEWRQILRRLVATLVSSYHRLDSTSSWDLIKSRGDISPVFARLDRLKYRFGGKNFVLRASKTLGGLCP